MRKLKLKRDRQIRRKKHIRKTIRGTEDRLRLTVFRSLNHFYAQIVNDIERKTLVSISTIDKDVRDQIKPDMNKVKQSQLVGKKLAEKAAEKGLKKVAFDRNGFLYHGRIKAFADAARKGGLEF